MELLHRVFLASYNFRLRRRTVPRAKLRKKRKRKREKKWEGNELLVRDLSIDESVCSLVERMYPSPLRNFRGKTSPVRMRIPQHPVPHSSRSSFSPFLFFFSRPPLSSTTLVSRRSLSLFHFSLRASTRRCPIPLCLLSTSAFLPNLRTHPAISLCDHCRPVRKVGKRDSRKSEFVLVTN